MCVCVWGGGGGRSRNTIYHLKIKGTYIVACVSTCMQQLCACKLEHLFQDNHGEAVTVYIPLSTR